MSFALRKITNQLWMKFSGLIIINVGANANIFVEWKRKKNKKQLGFNFKSLMNLRL